MKYVEHVEQMLADNERDMNLDMRDDEITCAACGGSNLSRRMEMDEFEYGAGEGAVSLSASVVVLTCNDCDFEFTGPSAEVARHEAVCRHLDIMTPAEIRDLRGRYGLSRQSFASITRLGAASIARWEAGSLLQSRAYDSLLYLLCFEDNLRRVRSRHTAAAPGESVSASLEAPGFTVSSPKYSPAGEIRDAPMQRSSDERLGTLISAFAEEWHIQDERGREALETRFRAYFPDLIE